LRFGGALTQFWRARGHLSEGLGWLERALRAGAQAPAPARAVALFRAGWLALYRGDYAAARTHFGGALALRRQWGDERGHAACLMSLGTVADLQGDSEEAIALLEESLALHRELGDRPGVAHALTVLGVAALYRRQYARAQERLEEGLVVARQLGNTVLIAGFLANLGRVALEQHDAARAQGLLREALPLFRDLGTPQDAADCLAGMAAVAGAHGDAVRGARLCGAAEALHEAAGASAPPGERALVERDVAAIRAQLSAPVFRVAWEQGRALSLEQAVEEALALPAQAAEQPHQAAAPVRAPAAPHRTSPLTRREWEVAALLAEGASNREIAARLVITERTAANHVQNILDKLELHSRGQIAAWARYEAPRPPARA
jgi:non-specific serine/threonine protein kinase